MRIAYTQRKREKSGREVKKKIYNDAKKVMNVIFDLSGVAVSQQYCGYFYI